MKLDKICIFFGVLVAGLLCDLAPLHAQPESGPSSNEASPDTSGDEPTSSDEDSSSEDESIVGDDPASAWSQGVSSEERQAARELLREGTRFYLIPLYARAAEQYAAALRKWKHPAIYYNLALTQRNLGKEIEARENFEHALKHGEKPLGAKRFREAQKQLAQLNRVLGRIRVICRTPGVEVTLDGVTLFTGPGSYEGWIRAQSHEITAKKAGYLSEARRVTVEPQQLQQVELKLITLDEAADESRRWAVWKPWAVVAVGAAITAAGGTLHAFAYRNFDSYDSTFQGLPCASDPPATPPGCKEAETDPMLNDQLERARLQQTVAVGAYITGGALLATGVVLLYLNRPQLAEQRVPKSVFKNAVITPMASENTVGVSVSVIH